MNTFSERLRFVRTLRGLTQAQLARACHISQSAIANYEAQTRHSAKEIFKMAEVLRVSAQWLAEGIGSMEHNAPALAARNSYQVADGKAPMPVSAWPFQDVSPDVYWTLSESDQKLIESTVAALVASLLHERSKE